MKRILVLLAEGFEELEVVAPVDIWRRAGYEVVLASVHDHKLLTSTRGIKIEADVQLAQVLSGSFDALFLPGGREGVMNLALNTSVADLCRQFYHDASKLLVAICAAPVVLLRAGLLEDRQITSFPGVKEELIGNVGAYVEELVVQDGNLLTSRAAGTSHLVGLEVVRTLSGAELAEQISKVMMFS